MAAAAYSIKIECMNGSTGASAALVQAQLSATWARARPSAYSTVITGVVKIGILSSAVYLQAISQSANTSCLTILSVYAIHCWQHSAADCSSQKNTQELPLARTAHMWTAPSSKSGTGCRNVMG